MRIAAGILGILMILFCVVQYNDPDALRWIAIYGMTAVFCSIYALQPAVLAKGIGALLLSVALVAAIAGMIWYWPTADGWWKQDVWWETETAREGMGMMIVSLFLAIIWLFCRRQKTLG